MKLIWPIPLVLFTIAFVILIQNDPSAKYEDPATHVATVVEKLDPEVAAEIAQPAENTPSALVREEAPPTKELTVLPAPVFEGSAITIEVWNRAARKAVPGALLLLAPEQYAAASESIQNNFRAWLKDNGQLFRCDENGQLRAPRTWLKRTMAAEASALWGVATLRENEYFTTVRIEVGEPQRLRVTVVDGEGETQSGVAVRLVEETYGNLKTRKEVITDAHGVAILLDISELNSFYWRPEGYALMAGSPPPPVPVAIWPLAELAKESQLLLAPTGSATVTLKDLEGNLVIEPMNIELRSMPLSGAEPRAQEDTCYKFSTQSESGSSKWNALPAGYRLRFEVDFEGCGNPEAFDIEALKPGEHRVIELRQQLAHPQLVFHVADSLGNPLRNQPLYLSVKADLEYQHDFGMQSAKVVSDSDGRATLQLGHAAMMRGDEVLLGRRLHITAREFEAGVVFSGACDISREFSIAEHDLGAILLAPKEQSLIARGQVVDTVGKPVVGAQISVSQYYDSGKSRGHVVGSNRFFGSTFVTGEEGSFEIYGTPPTGEAKVKASKVGFPNVEMTYLPGGASHLFVMDPGYVVLGEVIFPDGFENKGLVATFHPGGFKDFVRKDYRPNNPDRMLQAWGHRDGLFRVDDAPNRAGTLLIGAGRSWPFEPIAVLENVQPWRPGEPGDPRLNPLDLRDVVFQFKVTVMNELDEVLEDAKFITTTVRKSSSSGISSSSTSTRTTSSQRGKGKFLSIQAEYELTAVAAGYRAATFTLHEEHTVIQLEPAVRAEFILSWTPEMAKGCSVALGLATTDSNAQKSSLSPSRFDENGKLTATVSPGRYFVSLGIGDKNSSSTGRLTDSNGERVIIEVVDSSGLQTFSLAPQQDFFEDFLKDYEPYE